MKTGKITSAMLLMVLATFRLLSQAENVDLTMIYKIKQEGTINSKIEELAIGLTDLTGPRLTGSTGTTRGNEWAKKKMEEYGFQNVRIEEAGDFSRGGWDNLKTYAAMTSPYYANFACTPVAWTGSTNGLIKSDIVLFTATSEGDLEKFKGKLSGKIVLLSSTERYVVSYEPLASRYTEAELKDISIAQVQMPRRRPEGDFVNFAAQRVLRQKIAAFLKSEGVEVILNNEGTFNVPGSSQNRNYTAGSPEPVAELNLPAEAHGRIERLLRNNVPVEMEIEIQNRFFESPLVYNVIGEIPGTDKVLKNEVVLLGAHIDSYQGGTGAADNASGCVVMLEALRILKSLGVTPKRTIRVALWGGEEQGYYGSRGYVDKYLIDPETKEHKPDYDKFAAYFNMDYGSGKYRGIYIQQNDMVRPVFEEWLKPFADMGASTIANRAATGTDHLSFDEVGLPAFQFIQDPIEYDRGYHTNMDTYERLSIPDLRYNAIITASFAYNAAMRPAKLPGKPVVKRAGGTDMPPFMR